MPPAFLVTGYGGYGGWSGVRGGSGVSGGVWSMSEGVRFQKQGEGCGIPCTP